MDNDNIFIYGHEIGSYLYDNIKDEYLEIIEKLKRVEKLVSVANRFESKPYKFNMVWCIEEFESALWSGSMSSADDVENEEKLNNIISSLEDEEEKEIVGEMI